MNGRWRTWCAEGLCGLVGGGLVGLAQYATDGWAGWAFLALAVVGVGVWAFIGLLAALLEC